MVTNTTKFLHKNNSFFDVTIIFLSIYKKSTNP